MEQQYICNGFDKIRCYNKWFGDHCCIRHNYCESFIGKQNKDKNFGNPICEKRRVRYVSKFEYLMLKKLREK